MSIRHMPPATGHELPDALLDAARESILAVGWRRTTLTDIARRAGVSRMTIYRRCPDMASLLGDLLVREWGTLLEATALTEDREVSAESLATGVVALVRVLREEPLLARIVEVDPELLLPYLLHRRGRNQDRLLSLLADAVQRGQRAGTVRAGDSLRMARGLLLATQGFVLSATTMTDHHVSLDDLDAELHHLVERQLTP